MFPRYRRSCLIGGWVVGGFFLPGHRLLPVDPLSVLKRPCPLRLGMELFVGKTSNCQVLRENACWLPHLLATNCFCIWLARPSSSVWTVSRNLFLFPSCASCGRGSAVNFLDQHLLHNAFALELVLLRCTIFIRGRHRSLRLLASESWTMSGSFGKLLDFCWKCCCSKFGGSSESELGL